MSRWADMSERVEAYLRTRRQLGYELYIEGAQLQRFARFAEARGHRGALTVELALAWACDSADRGAIARARRLEVVRPLAKYCAAIEPETEIPPPRLLGPAHRRVTPHIYTDEAIRQMLAAAADLPPRHGLRGVTMRCLLGLLAATGLRISEALRLRRCDVDLEQGLVCVQQTKFRKSRYVPLHPTACEALAEYARLYAFQRIRERLGWDQGPGRRPRLYDLRHTFACHRLLSWYHDNIDVDWAMPLLATYLGHAKVTDTYWYFSSTPELMAVVAERFEHVAQPNVGEEMP